MINTEYVYTYYENSNNSKKCEVSVKVKGTDKGMFNYPVGRGKTLEEAVMSDSVKIVEVDCFGRLV